MFGALNEQIVTLHLPASATTAKKTNFFKFPRSGSIKQAYLASGGGVLTANTTTGYAPAIMNGGTVGISTLTALTFGSVATPYTQTANQGYAASAAGGTTSLRDFTEGQWAIFDEELAGAPTAALVTVCAHVVLGTARVA